MLLLMFKKNEELGNPCTVGRAKSPKAQTNKTLRSPPPPSPPPPHEPRARPRARPWRASCHVRSCSPLARPSTSRSRRRSAALRCSAPPPRRPFPSQPRRHPLTRCSPGAGPQPPLIPHRGPRRCLRDSSLASAGSAGDGVVRRRRNGRSRRRTPRRHPRRPRRVRSSSTPASASRRTCLTTQKFWFVSHSWNLFVLCYP
jgi:hypothetical protein